MNNNKKEDWGLLKELCSIHAPSGNESAMTNFIIDHVKREKKNWKVTPKVYSGKGFQDCVVLVFGKPKTAIYAHIDSIGYTVKYDKEVVLIGKPIVKTGVTVVGVDSKGKIDCSLIKQKDSLYYKFKREIAIGTRLTYKPNFRETKNYVQCCYMDNRLGVWNALQVAKTLRNGAIVFSCWEEHGGGSVGYLSKFLYEKYKVDQSLISDITWVTNGVKAGQGCAISMRDSGLPRKAYIDRIIEIARKSKVPFQLEVENAGGSDGNYIQRAPYPIDWCFVGAPESNVHTPDEKVHKDDIISMVELYKVLMGKL